MLIEKYIGKTGRKLFLLFCWLFCGIVIAAFVAGTFNAYGADGALVEAAQTNGAAGMVSIMFMVFAVIFGAAEKVQLLRLEGKRYQASCSSSLSVCP